VVGAPVASGRWCRSDSPIPLFWFSVNAELIGKLLEPAVLTTGYRLPVTGHLPSLARLPACPFPMKLFFIH
jgi:hypothetical protein